MGLFGDIFGAITGGIGMAQDAKRDKRNYDLSKQQFEHQQTIDEQNYEMANKNYQLGVDNLNWTKDAQQTTWMREDNAMQRKVKDMEAAGLNKVLAAGGAGAPTSSPASLNTPPPPRHADAPSPPQMPVRGVDRALAAMNMMSMRNNVARSDAERALLEVQKRRTEQEALGQSLNNQVIAQTVRDKDLAYAVQMHDWDLIKDSNRRSNAPAGLVDQVRQITDLLSDNTLHNQIKDAIMPLVGRIQKGDGVGDMLKRLPPHKATQAERQYKEGLKPGNFFQELVNPSKKTREYLQKPNNSAKYRGR